MTAGPRRLLLVAAALLAALPLGGCFDSTVALRAPATGNEIRCRSSARGLDPWTQTDACVAAAVAQGWVPRSR